MSQRASTNFVALPTTTDHPDMVTGGGPDTNIATFIVSDSKEGGMEDDSWNNWKATARKCIVEFIGDFIFIYLGSMSSVATTGLLGGALCHGICIAVLIASMGHISGGHFNPAVTLGIAVSGNIHPILAVLYVIAQLTGGLFGAMFVKAGVKDDVYMRIAGGTTNFDPSNAFVGNALVTATMTSYFLVQTVLCSAVDTDSNVLAPLAIGFSILVDALAAGQVSGASMNPARSFGPACAYSMFYHNVTSIPNARTPAQVWSYHYLHWVGPIIGAILAGLVYKAVLAKMSKRWLLK